MIFACPMSVMSMQVKKIGSIDTSLVDGFMYEKKITINGKRVAFIDYMYKSKKIQYGNFFRNQKVCQINWIHTKNTERSKGYAERLLQGIMLDAEEAGCKYVELVGGKRENLYQT